jgi:hypothetical protein
MAKSATQDNVINLPVTPPTAPPSPDRAKIIKDRDRREARSAIIKAAVMFCAMRGAIRGGFEADHTGDCVIANWNSTAGFNYEDLADRVLVKLTRLTRSSKTIETVELRSLATVAERIQKDADGMSHLEEFEQDFLLAFAQAVGRVCRDRSGLHQGRTRLTRQWLGQKTLSGRTIRYVVWLGRSPSANLLNPSPSRGNAFVRPLGLYLRRLSG